MFVGRLNELLLFKFKFNLSTKKNKKFNKFKLIKSNINREL